MSTFGPLDAITIDSLRIIKLFKQKYSESDIETMMSLAAIDENTLSQADRMKMKEFAQDFDEYFRAVRAAKLPPLKEAPDNRTIEERFPEFAAALTYSAPKPHCHVVASSDDSDDEENVMDKKNSLLRNSPK
jgi:hypothetical protein